MDYTRARTHSSSLEGEQGQVDEQSGESEVSRQEIWGWGFSVSSASSPSLACSISSSSTLQPLIQHISFLQVQLLMPVKLLFSCPPCVQGGVEHLRWVLLKDKLMHIKILLPFYLSKNLLESAAPNRKWLGALCDQKPGRTYIDKVRKQRKEAI